MYKAERQRAILKKINAERKVSVQELADHFGITKVTIRKDLDELAAKKLLTRTFGGAIPYDTVIRETKLRDREAVHSTEKLNIGLKAQEFITNGMTLFLDAGTTTGAIVPYLKDKENLTVITYDIKIAYELSSFKNVKTIVLGGTLDTVTISTYGIETFKALHKMQIDLSFIGCEAFDLQCTYSASDTRSNLKQAVLSSSKESILLADSSKYSNRSLYIVDAVKEFKLLITDQKNSELVSDLADSDVEYCLV